MDTREFPVLAPDDEPVVDRLAAGLSDDAARVLAYLGLRSTEDDVDAAPATETAIRIGTGLGGTAVGDAIADLESRGLIETTTVRTETSGRPPNAWYVSRSLESIAPRVYDQHAEALLGQARRFCDLEDATDDDRLDENPAGGGDDLRPVALGLNWDPNALQLPVSAALTDDAYADRGLAVERERYGGSRRAVDAVVDGDATVGIAGAATILRARADGEPVAPLASLFQRPMVVLYTTRDAFGGVFETASQLRGRRVGMPIESEAGVLGRLFLLQAGVREDVELVDVSGEEHDALRSGDVDVVTGAIADPLRVEATGATVDRIHVAERYPIYGPTLVASERSLVERPDLLGPFLAGTVAGWASATSSPDDAVAALADETGRDPARIERVFERAVEEFDTTKTVSRRGWGWQSPDTWSRLETALDRVSLLEGDP